MTGPPTANIVKSFMLLHHLEPRHDDDRTILFWQQRAQNAGLLVRAGARALRFGEDAEALDVGLAGACGVAPSRRCDTSNPDEKTVDV